MTNQPTAQTYRAARIQALRDWMREAGLEAVVLYSRENTRYFTGFTGTESYALITADKLQIFLDSRYQEQGKAQCPEYEMIPANSGLLADVNKALQQLGLKKVGLEAEYLPWHLALSLHKANEGVEFLPLTRELAALRVIKDEEELRLLRRAIWISDEAWRQLLPTIRAGQTENQIAAQLEHNMRMLGASCPSFSTIMASGVRGALPHGRATDKEVQAGEAITMDFGALYEGYCSDITRTVFLGTPNPEILKIYEAVLEAQLEGERVLRSGVTGASVHEAARSVLEKHGYAKYFGHGLGHSLGLEIHESPRCSPTYNELLPAGCMMTVEPGVYIPGLGGVRIEDTCLVREKDCEVITAADKSVIVLQA